MTQSDPGARQELALILAVSDVLHDETGGVLHDRIGRALGEIAIALVAELVVLRTPDDDGQHLVVQAVGGVLAPGLDAQVHVPVGEGLPGTAFTGGRPLVVTDLALEAEWQPDLVHAGIRAVVAVPFQSRNRGVGVLTVSSIRVGHFTPRHVLLLTEVVDRIGTFLESARLRGERDLRILELEALMQMTDILAHDGALDEKTRRVLDLVADLSDAMEVVLRVPDEDAGGFRLVATSTNIREPSPVPVVPFDQGLLAEARRTGKPVVSMDYRASGAISAVLQQRADQIGIRAIAVLPIFRGTQLYATLGIFSRQMGHFTSERIRLLAAIADGVGVVLADARIRERERAESEARLALANIARILGGAGALQSKAGEALGELVRITGADWATLRSPNDDGATMRLVAVAGDIEAPEVLPAKLGLYGAAIAAKGPVRSDVYAEDPRAVEVALDHGAASAIAAPALLDNHLVAVALVASREARHFTDRHVEILSTVADRLGGLIDDARLRESEHRASRANSALVTMATILSEDLTFQQKVNRTLDALTEAIGADWAAFRVPTEDGANLRLVGSSGPEAPPETIPVGAGISGVALGERRVVLSQHYDTDERRLPDVAALTPRSVIAAPVTSGDRSLGVIILASRADGHFGDGDAIMLAAFANGFGTLLDGARLREAQIVESEGRALLVTTSRILASSAPLEQKSRHLVEEVARIMDATSVVLRVPTADGLSLDLLASHPAVTIHGSVMPTETGVMGAALRDGRLVRWDRYAEEAGAPPLAVTSGIRSAMATPVDAGGRTIGVIAVLSNEEARFGERESRLLDDLSDGLGVLLEDARIRQEEQERREEAETLLDLSVALAGSGGFRNRMDAAIAGLSAKLDNADIFVRAIDEDGERAHLIAATGLFRDRPQTVLLSSHQPIVDVLASGEALVVNDYATDPLPQGDDISRLGLGSAAYVPIVASGRAAGILVIASPLARHFDPRRLRLLRAVASNLA